MSESILIGPGIQVSVDGQQIVKIATCISTAAAEDAACVWADDERGLGAEHVLKFGPWCESSPTGWREAMVISR